MDASELRVNLFKLLLSLNIDKIKEDSQIKLDTEKECFSIFIKTKKGAKGINVEYKTLPNMDIDFIFWLGNSNKITIHIEVPKNYDKVYNLIENIILHSKHRASILKIYKEYRSSYYKEYSKTPPSSGHTLNLTVNNDYKLTSNSNFTIKIHYTVDVGVN